MNSVNQVKSWPNDAVVEAIQGRIVKVYEGRVVNTANGQKSIQSAELQDSANDKIRLSVWEHPDLKPLEGKDVVLVSTRGGNGKVSGVKVVHGSYVATKDGANHRKGDTVQTIELSVSKSGAFQLQEVYRASNPSQEQVKGTSGNGQAEDSKQSSPTKSIHGATVGAAINNACANLTARGESLNLEAIYPIASGLVRLHLKMESGDLAPEKPGEESPF